MRRVVAWVLVLGLTAIVTAVTIGQVLDRYNDLRSGWSWDLAYYNQWFWALTQGDGVLTVRPLAAYAEEGPSIWKMNYLAPIRFLIAPIYGIWPDPRTLLIVQAVVFWWCIPASYRLVRDESGSDWIALSGAGLVPLTPLLWPLAWNDFRELQLAVPFLIWALAGVRGRSIRLASLGIGGLLACRQEFALVVASLAIVPAREPEAIDRSYRWARVLVFLGLAWMLFGFLGYLKLVVGPQAANLYLEQFRGPKATWAQTSQTALDFLFIGLGPWALLMLWAPRTGLVALPWTWSLSSGRWALGYIGTEQWHHVRYAAPMAGLVLASGLVGYARLMSGIGGRARTVLTLAAILLGFAAAGRELAKRFARVPVPISRTEAAEIRYWMQQVGPEEGILATYEVTAPLSSRRILYSYVLAPNPPNGKPDMGREFHWPFLRRGDLDQQILIDQGFERVYRGSFLELYRR
jgi:hypothetical protein